MHSPLGAASRLRDHAASLLLEVVSFVVATHQTVRDLLPL